MVEDYFIVCILYKHSDGSPPEIGENSSSEEEEQYSGQPYSFRCCVNGNPIPSMEWRKDGRLLSQHFMSRIFELKEKNQVLEIRQVLPEDSGIFTCNAVNEYGQDNYTIDFYVFGK